METPSPFGRSSTSLSPRSLHGYEPESLGIEGDHLGNTLRINDDAAYT